MFVLNTQLSVSKFNFKETRHFQLPLKIKGNKFVNYFEPEPSKVCEYTLQNI